MHTYHFPPAPGSTPWAPAWSPDGLALAVGLSGSVWEVDAETGEARELTEGPAYHSSPTWSPDGRWIVFTADTPGRSIQLHVLDRQSGASRPLTDDTANYADPQFAPDGTRLVYTASLPNGYFNVFTRAIRDGAWAGEPVQVTMEGTLGRDRPYFTAQDMHVTPTWLPNGRELLLVSNRGVALGSGRVVRVPAEAGGLARARVVVDEQTLYQARPAVSPDGARVAFVSADGGRHPWNRLRLLALPEPAGPGAGPGTNGRPAPDVDGTEGKGVAAVDGAFDVFFPRWSPDGRTIAYLSNASGLPELHLLDVASGASRPLPIGRRIWRRPAGVLALHIADAATGRGVAARVHLTAADGRFYAPDDAYARVSWAGDRVFHGDGDDRLEVPAGRVTLDVVRGFEYEPMHLEVEVGAGQVTRVEVALRRVANLAAEGWISGSTGAHLHAGGLLRYDPRQLVFQAEAEDVQVVNNAVASRDPRVTPADLFAWGRPPHPLSTPERLLVFGQEYRPPFHGHVAFFGDGHAMPELFPVTIGYEDNPPPTLAPSNTAVLRAAKARGALTSYVHAFSGEGDPMQAGLGLGKAFLVDAALGLADTLEWASASRGAFIPWYAALNNGFRVTAIGGEDTVSNLHIMRLLGCVRTYANAGVGPLTADRWWGAVREGRTFVTTGPLVGLTVDGRGPGEEVSLPASGGTVEVTGWVRSVTALQRVVLVANGEEVADIPLEADRRGVRFSRRLPVPRSGWIHLRAEGAPTDRFPLDALYAQAFTNPTWLSVGGQPVRDRASAEYALKWIDTLQLMAEAWPGWTSATEKQAVFADFDAARTEYRRRLADAGGR
jgi:Tol biopolymer transport system component